MITCYQIEISANHPKDKNTYGVSAEAIIAKRGGVVTLGPYAGQDVFDDAAIEELCTFLQSATEDMIEQIRSGLVSRTRQVDAEKAEAEATRAARQIH